MENKLQNQTGKEITTQQKNITDNVLNRIKELESDGNLQTPPNYSYQNALKSAFLILSEITVTKKEGNEFKNYPVLEYCTQTSICNTLLDMCIQGLSAAKHQAYFIPYGRQLQLSRSYLGSIAVTKRLEGVKDVKAFVIYEGDKFDLTFNKDTLNLDFDYKPSFKNISNDLNKITGAFAIVIGENNEILHTEVMTIDEIKAAWRMGKTFEDKNGKENMSSTHHKHPGEMAKKSVINRACKHYIDTSDDSNLFVESVIRTNDYDEEDIIETTHEEVQEEINENAGQKVIDIESKPVEEPKEEGNEPF